MSRVLTYDLEGETSRRFLDLRYRAADEHMFFRGNEREGEFYKSYPDTPMQLKGLYAVDDGLLSIILTDVPEEIPMDSVERLFRGLTEDKD